MVTISRLRWSAALAFGLFCAGAFGEHPMLGEIRLEPASRAERDAGVWVDGQYLGFVKELDGRDRLLLLPGRHELVVKLAGYEELTSTVTVEPATTRRYAVRLAPLATASYPDVDQTATVRLSVEPERAALFVDDVYAGHVDRFGGRDGVRIRAGTHQIRIELPGYRPFVSEMTLIANQRYEIKTELLKGSVEPPPEDLAARND
jgi:hypothetical protein